MATCPYCSAKLLRHVRDTQIYWFCRHCWWELPLVEAIADRPMPQPLPLRERQPSFLTAFQPTHSESSDDRTPNSSLL
ncbi:hypothetical protein ACN4EK_03865 [Pantanalinema rosaneae CENA516]|uniref:hypothetical protein n=1 Tax=Pantanalinema rosaneae TaxID=1620701 RepID=UPI003D6E953D